MMNIVWNAAQVRETTGNLLSCPAEVYSTFRDMGTLSQESVQIATLNAKRAMIDRHLITLGLANASLAHPREVFRPAIVDGATSILVIHNHPSGDPTPSGEDLHITRQLIEAGKIIGIFVIDHIIIGRPIQHRLGLPYVSFREMGLADFSVTE
jgi:DNA repair protein RadC